MAYMSGVTGTSIQLSNNNIKNNTTMIIFRVETRYGVHDANTLRGAKASSKPQDHIQAVAPDGLTILSRVTRRGATPSWAIKVCEKYGLDCEI